MSVFLGLASAGYAQLASEVKFPKGQFGTMLSGTITGQEYYDYKLKANAGQKLYLELTVAKNNGN